MLGWGAALAPVLFPLGLEPSRGSVAHFRFAGFHLARWDMDVDSATWARTVSGMRSLPHSTARPRDLTSRSSTLIN